MHQRIIPKLALADKEMLDGLEKAGFQYTLGPHGSGFIMMALEKAGGYVSLVRALFPDLG